MKTGAVVILIAAMLAPPTLASAKPHDRDRGRGEYSEARGGFGGGQAGGPARRREDRRERPDWVDREDRDRPGRGRGEGGRRRDDDGWGGPPVRPGAQMRGGQDQARDAVNRGRHVPLGGVVDRLRRRSPGGRLLDAGLEDDGRGRPVYRVRWSTGDGRRVDYIVDARTGVVIGEDD